MRQNVETFDFDGNSVSNDSLGEQCDLKVRVRALSSKRCSRNVSSCCQYFEPASDAEQLGLHRWSRWTSFRAQ